MAYRIRWTDTALHRADEIADSMGGQDPERAVGWLHDLFERLDQLAEHPLMAPRWPRGRDPSLRRLVIGQYKLIYRVHESDRVITLLTIRHGRQQPLGPEDL